MSPAPRTVSPSPISASARSPLPIAVVVCGVLATLSLVLVAPTPSYDPWMWIVWGRELAHGTLSTAEGPAFKPLPVAVTTLLAVLGDVAPTAWVLLVRASSLLAIWLAFRLARRLADAATSAGARTGVAAGVLAAIGVALCAGFPTYAATGQEAGPLLALVLLGVEAGRASRWRLALACGLGCALLRVEAWPFLLVLAVVAWRDRPRDRPLLAAAAAAVPVAWFVPELLGSGDLLRSGSRALVPNPGQPALAEVPALASLGEAAGLPLWPLWAGVLLLAIDVRRRRASRAVLVPAAVGMAWIAIVAAMAQVGFSGEARYAMPGAALVAISGAIGIGSRLGRGLAAHRGVASIATAAAVAALTMAIVPRLADLADLRDGQAYQRGLSAQLAEALRVVGGRDAVLACGAPVVGNLRGPLMAYHLDVPKHVVDFVPSGDGMVFRSSRSAGAPMTPDVAPRYAEVARAGRWRVHAACAS